MTTDKIKVGDGLATFTSGDTVITLWQKDATRGRLEWWNEQVAILAERSPNGMVALSLIASTSGPPDAAVRKLMQGEFRRLGDKLRQLVVLPLGNSIWVSVVRTIVRGTLLLSGMTDRQQVASSLRDGIDRLRRAGGPETPGRAEINAAVAALHHALGMAPLDEAAREAV